MSEQREKEFVYKTTLRAAWRRDRVPLVRRVRRSWERTRPGRAWAAWRARRWNRQRQELPF